MSLIIEDINKGLLFVKTKNMPPRLRQILAYRYDVKETELNKMKQNELDSLMAEKMNASKTSILQQQQQQQQTPDNNNDNDNNNNVQ